MAAQTRNDHLRFINWISGSGSPQLFNPSDFGRLKSAAEQGRLFARKFDVGDDRELLHRIERELLRD